jgi:hypothetical protein
MGLLNIRVSPSTDGQRGSVQLNEVGRDQIVTLRGILVKYKELDIYAYPTGVALAPYLEMRFDFLLAMPSAASSVMASDQEATASIIHKQRTPFILVPTLNNRNVEIASGNVLAVGNEYHPMDIKLGTAHSIGPAVRFDLGLPDHPTITPAGNPYIPVVDYIDYVEFLFETSRGYLE